MANVKVEVCSCCALNQPFIADAVARLQAEYGDRLEVTPRKCLDICKDGAVKIGAEIMAVTEAELPTFEAKVRKALG
ncbi:MAG TPA: hypothetical protein VNT01_17485 [Symbiobacteriaceae bacterium]|nr:hypothetical protein [Symbiobacteriaceae bacterium]